GKERVAFEFTFDQGEIKVGAERQRLLVNLRASANEIVQKRTHRAELQKVFYDPQIARGHTAHFRKLKLVWGRTRRLASRDPGLAKETREFPLQRPWMPTQDNVDAIWQWCAKTLEGFSSDNDHVACGHFLEPFEILRQMPRDFVSRADHPVQRHRGDSFEVLHRVEPQALHTAIGALMAGCG